MIKHVLPLLLVLGFTACNERQPGMQRTVSDVSSSIVNNTSTPIVAEEVLQVKRQKIVEKNEPVIPTPKPKDTYIHTPIPILDDDVISPETKTFTERTLPTQISTPTSLQNIKPHTTKSQTFTGGTVTDGLDIGTIRLGLNNGTTRLVFDSYKWNMNVKTPTKKAKSSGHYNFKYDAKNRRITAVISGYRGFSALNATKPRFFRTSNMVEKIYLETYLDDSGYKFSIQLNQDAQVNVFELKEPARIIVDITPR
jgi:hypothetical protein